ncbi:hypothetical protein [Paraburkholderia solisilvae]|uniref:hypothetical protein n=1 Tax=Paraburkholderia solisilvae TaxID=624376 RepID=UPI001583F2F1|nr:hypothetical protein [Paraburkholderia solisilvae]
MRTAVAITTAVAAAVAHQRESAIHSRKRKSSKKCGKTIKSFCMSNRLSGAHRCLPQPGTRDSRTVGNNFAPFNPLAESMDNEKQANRIFLRHSISMVDVLSSIPERYKAELF